MGQAAVRTHPPYYYNGGYYPSHPIYYPSYGYGYGSIGLGYFYYDPFWWGYGWPYPTYGYYPYGGYYGGYYGGGAYYGSNIGVSVGYADPGGSYGGSSTNQGYYGSGKLRLKVKPRDAEVYVDGYFMGRVDDFDGTFERLQLDAGPHRVEVRKAGFVSMTFEVRIPTDETVTYRGELRPVQ